MTRALIRSGIGPYSGGGLFKWLSTVPVLDAKQKSWLTFLTETLILQIQNCVLSFHLNKTTTPNSLWIYFVSVTKSGVFLCVLGMQFPAAEDWFWVAF